MKPEIQPIENEIDIRKLCQLLWGGKLWIIGLAALFGISALIYSYLVKEEWSAMAITDKPMVDMLGDFYPRQQFLRNVYAKNSEAATTPSLSIADEIYQEFLKQLASYDTRREFWLQSDYYLDRKENNSQADAVLLDELIRNITTQLNDPKTNLGDSVKLVAETAQEANQQLRLYVNFASQRAATLLNNEIKTIWSVRASALDNQLKQQENGAIAIYQRDLNALKLAIKTAEQQGIEKVFTDIPVKQLPNSTLFLLGKPLLQSQVEALQAEGPHFDNDYFQSQALLTELSTKPEFTAQFQTYRYLRTPEPPVKRDKPRRFFLLILWGGIGAMCGAGVALTRRVTKQK